MKYELLFVSSWEEAEEAAAEGWELVSVTAIYKTWQNERKGYQESETYETYYFKRPLIPPSRKA